VSAAGQVRVVCTDKGTHGSRELALLTLEEEGDEPELLAALIDRGVDPKIARVVYEREMHNRLSYVSEGFRRRDKGRHPGGDQAKRTDVRAVPDEDTGKMPRWRFRCPTCRRDVQMRNETALLVVEGLLSVPGHADTPSLDVSLLPANFG
jgi:hypothetical protein